MMRKKYNIPVILGVILLVFGMVGCDREQEVVAPITPDGYPMATFVTDFTGNVINEGDTITYTITLDKQVLDPISFGFRINSGTATDHDFEVIGGTIAPYSSETTLMIVASRDYINDPDLTAVLEIGTFDIPTREMLNPKTVNPVHELTIKNYVSPILSMTFGWDYDISIDNSDMYNPDYGEVENTYDMVDFDIFIADADGYDFDDPWATFNPAVMAATGDTPEVMEFDITTLPEGSYYIFCGLWYNDFSYVDTMYNVIADIEGVLDTVYYGIEHQPMPIVATFERQGSFDEFTLLQAESQWISTSTPGEDQTEDGQYDGTQRIYTTVAKVTIEGDTYIISEIDDTEVGRGRINNTPTLRPNSLRK